MSAAIVERNDKLHYIHILNVINTTQDVEEQMTEEEELRDAVRVDCVCLPETIKNMEEGNREEKN